MVYGGGAAGAQIAGRLAASGTATVLAGRDEARTAAAAHRLGLPWRCADLTIPRALDELLGDAHVVVNAAGPFGRTAAPLMRASIRNGCHYVDISNEISSFHEAWSLDGQAREARISIVPGAGYGTAVTEALARHVAARIGDPTRLTVVRSSSGSTRSVGVKRTSFEMLSSPAGSYAKGALARKAGAVRTFALPEGRRAGVLVASGDLFSTAQATGVPNVATYFSTSMHPLLARVLVPSLRAAAKTGLVGGRGAGERQRGPARTRAEGRSGQAARAGQAAQAAQAAWSRVWIRAENSKGQTATSYLEAGKGSDMTALIAVEIARQTTSGAAPGAHTSGSLLDADFVFGLPGVTLTDL